jgi:3-oxoacyl-[acyl-carrier protein] reductase
MKNAIITGAGRNKGIGAEVCRTFAMNGINVFFTTFEEYDTMIGGFSHSDYNKTLAECQLYGVKAFFQCFDLTNIDSIEELFSTAQEKLGDIDILVNCACYHESDSIENLDSKVLDINFNVNAKAILLLCREFFLRFSGTEGRIINLSSTQNFEALISEISYAVSKAAIPIIVSTLAPIMAKKSITINAVNPGATEIGGEHDRNLDVYLKNNLSGRLGLPKDAANIIFFLASEEGKWITGQTINSEGGLFRRIK